MIELRGIAPLMLVYDMGRTLQFYCEVLGFKLVGKAEPESYPEWAMVELNSVQVMFEPIYPAARRPPQPDPVRMSFHTDTVLYFGCPDVDAAYVHLRSKGIDLAEPVQTRYGFKAIYLIDPDGYKLVWHWPLEG